jgi:dihydroneopterin aldolase
MLHEPHDLIERAVERVAQVVLGEVQPRIGQRP